MRLIAEQITKAEFILEDRKGGGKNYFIEGIFLQAELKNKNGRMYHSKLFKGKLLNMMRTILLKAVHWVS